uniref:Amidinotransferase n=1 Tax=Ditylenchus dipsaci TaxID=166011 RepID=A0A915CPV2_9BILA
MAKPLARILMCRPTFFQVKYSINPWMDPCTAVDNTKAMKQWETLRQSIVQAGGQVVVMEPTGADLYPDLVFTANAAVERTTFTRGGFKNMVTPHAKIWRSLSKVLEMLFGWAKTRNKLFCGIGPRTDVRALKNVAEKLKDVELPFKAYGLRLIDPRFYHIDTCFCPLTDDLALYYPHAFDPISRHNLANELELVPVDEQDACRFACNAVVVGKTVIMHQGSENTAKMLEKIGFKTHFLDMSEFIKSGGSAKCCTLRL